MFRTKLIVMLILPQLPWGNSSRNNLQRFLYFLVVSFQWSKQCQRIFPSTGTCSSASCYTARMIPGVRPVTNRRLHRHERILSKQVVWMGPPYSIYWYSCEPCWLQSPRTPEIIILQVDMCSLLPQIFPGSLVPPQAPFHFLMRKHLV